MQNDKKCRVEKEEKKQGMLAILPAKMHPADQMSIDVEYCFDPINTSGALYHNVTTYDRPSKNIGAEKTQKISSMAHMHNARK